MRINRSEDTSAQPPKQPAVPAQPASAQPQQGTPPKPEAAPSQTTATLPALNPNTRQGAWQAQRAAGHTGVRASIQPPTARVQHPAQPAATPPQGPADAPKARPAPAQAPAKATQPTAQTPPKAVAAAPQPPAPMPMQPPEEAPERKHPDPAVLFGDTGELPPLTKPARAPEPPKHEPTQEPSPSVPPSPSGGKPAKAKPQKEKKMKKKPPKPQYDGEEEEETRRPRWHAPLGCLILLLFIALVGFGVWQGSRLYNEVSGGHELGEETAFRVEQGASVAQIAKDLQAAGFVEHDWLFRYYTQYSGKESGVQFGEHILQKGMSYNDILDSLSQQVERRETVTLTFPEGTTAVGIGQILQDNGMCTIADFLACANGDDGTDWSNYAFWSQIPENPGRLLKCEGYLFPNTYEFYADATVKEIVDTFYKEFDRQISDLAEKINASGMSIDEAVILASFIQEEAGFTEGEEALINNQRVAACFYNRLHSTDPLWSGHQLESNASSYITNDGDNNYLWNSPMAAYMGWRDAGAIPDEVLAAYDTYRISGLPAGAISNPGRVAIEAALTPDQQYIDEGYYFFVTGHPDTDVAGQYFFGKTADEHSANVVKAGWG